jgi:hypothetical protein
MFHPLTFFERFYVITFLSQAVVDEPFRYHLISSKECTSKKNTNKIVTLITCVCKSSLSKQNFSTQKVIS